MYTKYSSMLTDTGSFQLVFNFSDEGKEHSYLSKYQYRTDSKRSKYQHRTDSKRSKYRYRKDSKR